MGGCERERERERGEDYDPFSLRKRSVVRNSDEESDKGGWESMQVKCTAKRYWLCERWF